MNHGPESQLVNEFGLLICQVPQVTEVMSSDGSYKKKKICILHFNENLQGLGLFKG